VDAASATLQREGMAAVLRVPLDLPLIRTADLAAVLAAAAAGAQAVLVPSLSGTGTNALYRSPPTLFPSRFGPGSLALHEQEARRVTAAVRVLQLASLALDIDDAADVRELARRGEPCPALDYLRALGIERRLADRPRETA
jgi:2-phospho-L-lactate guanylyltransferase